MGILQKVAGFFDWVEAGVHLPCPLAAPFFVENIVGTSPDKVDGFSPLKQGVVKVSLGGAVPVIVIIETDG